MKITKKRNSESDTNKIEELKKITMDLIHNGYGSDMIGMDPESLVKMALKHAKHVYKSKQILNSFTNEHFLD